MKLQDITTRVTVPTPLGSNNAKTITELES